VISYSRKNPFPATLKERVLLNGQGSDKETIHLEFDLEGSGLTYNVGDSLAVIPHNAEDVVSAVLKASKLDAESEVTLKDVSFTLVEALRAQLDITALSKPVLNRYNEIAQSEKLDSIINDKAVLNEFIAGRDLADLLATFPTEALTAQGLASSLRKLPPRLYSIASSLKAHEEEVHLTVGVVRYDSHGRERKGVCSTFLADRIEEGQKAGVFVTANKNFKLPDNPETPIIMVGPGTGIAPFRAFIEERAATNASGKNWLFFGDQHYQNDFLYQLEWQDYMKDGVLTKIDVAFSRDQPHKIYVQDRMHANSKELFQWLEDGASFYVCGDASRMAHDVDQALHAIIAEEGKLSESAAAEYVKALKSDKRYLRDVY
jgi:sulfite reductase (NADPH) flavoprotein alpha-component